jgi:hypothetical protein
LKQFLKIVKNVLTTPPSFLVKGHSPQPWLMRRNCFFGVQKPVLHRTTLI